MRQMNLIAFTVISLCGLTLAQNPPSSRPTTAPWAAVQFAPAFYPAKTMDIPADSPRASGVLSLSRDMSLLSAMLLTTSTLAEPAAKEAFGIAASECQARVRVVSLPIDARRLRLDVIVMPGKTEVGADAPKRLMTALVERLRTALAKESQMENDLRLRRSQTLNTLKTMYQVCQNDRLESLGKLREELGTIPKADAPGVPTKLLWLEAGDAEVKILRAKLDAIEDELDTIRAANLEERSVWVAVLDGEPTPPRNATPSR